MMAGAQVRKLGGRRLLRNGKQQLRFVQFDRSYKRIDRRGAIGALKPALSVSQFRRRSQ
jgi:hypothetical protein